jgi:hypothetical protein
MDEQAFSFDLESHLTYGLMKGWLSISPAVPPIRDNDICSGLFADALDKVLYFIGYVR